jgi:carboxymethylenebutenolidase
MLALEKGRAHLALPEAGQGAGVILLHAWWGLTDFFIAQADRLAGEGFVVLAPDVYHGATANTVKEAEALNETLQIDTVTAQLDEAVEFLKTHPAVTSTQPGVVGFSLGAYLGLHMANRRPDEIGAMAAFYGTYDGGELSAMRAAFLGHFAETDPYAPREDVEALEQTLTSMNLEATFHIYPGTGHWFFEADRTAYHPESARLAWERTLAFLRAKLEPTASA